VKPDIVLDAKNLSCPQPLLRTKQALQEMLSGQILEVVTSDLTTKSTFPPFLLRSGDELLDISEEDGVVRHFIRKK
jgi:tRNA 2-thiouridine synthesizing protein A